MMKWLAVGGVVLAGIAIFILVQLGSADDVVVASGTKVATLDKDEKFTTGDVRSAKLPTTPVSDPVDDGKPKKLDPQSDAFFFQFDEMVPKKLTMAAAECYENVGLNRKHRNQRLKVAFNNVIKDGKVYVQGMKMLEDSNLNDPVMEKCMMDKMAGVVWENDALPDGTWEDQLTISPERGMKKYTKENMAYEGDGPIGKAVMKSPTDPGLKSDSASKTDFDSAEEARIEAGGLPEGMK